MLADPFLNIFTRINRAIFVRRGESDELAFQESLRVLQEGKVLIMYPEGTLGPGNGKLLEFKRGIARLAFESQLPVYPLATYGIDEIFGKGAKFPRSKGIIKLKYGEPIPLSKLFKNQQQGKKPDFQKAAKKIERTVQKLWTDLWIIEQAKEKMQMAEKDEE